MVTQVNKCENCALHSTAIIAFTTGDCGALAQIREQLHWETIVMFDNKMILSLSLIYNLLYERAIINSNGPAGNKGTVLIDLIDLYT